MEKSLIYNMVIEDLMVISNDYIFIYFLLKIFFDYTSRSASGAISLIVTTEAK